jgi:acetyl-CoA carboxylase biotin carboxyl carrier protein
MLTPDDVRDIVRVLDSTTLDEFHVQTGDVDVTLRRHGSSPGWTAEALVTRAPRELPARGPHATDAGRPGQIGQPAPATEPAVLARPGSTTGSAAVTGSGSATEPAAVAGSDSATEPAAGAGSDSATEPAEGAAPLHRITPPLLGTFYRAPQPGAAPFVEVDSIVDAETVVGIIETMKMMNPVHAGVAGRVVRICLADAAFAEAGATLMLIEELP